MMPADADFVLGVVACERGGGARERRIVDIGKSKMAATARQRDGDCASDAAGGSGDDGRAAFELQHNRSLSPFKDGVVSRRVRAPGHWRPVLRRIWQQTLGETFPGKPPRGQFDAQLAAFVDAIETGYAARNGIWRRMVRNVS